MKNEKKELILQYFNEDLVFKYKPSITTYEIAMLLIEKLGKLNNRMQNLFKTYDRPSRIFAFIESKYSSKIEGVYTTLFDVVNTGLETGQQKLIKPIVDELFQGNKSPLSMKKIMKIENILNYNIPKNSRYKKKFGVYATFDKNSIKIYEPPLEKKVINKLLEDVIEKSCNDKNVIDMIHTHIIFEKIHPFVDSNGRIGRLLLQKTLAKFMNFASVLPISSSIYNNKMEYYSIFNFTNNQELDDGVQKMLNIFMDMYRVTKKFIIDLTKWVDKNVEKVKEVSNKVTDEMALDILLTLQTKSMYINKKYKLNVKTINKIFDKINNVIPFNRKIVRGLVTYWNIELEEIIDHYYQD